MIPSLDSLHIRADGVVDVGPSEGSTPVDHARPWPYASRRLTAAALAIVLAWHTSRFDGGRRADLSGADLRDADLRGADLRGADLRDADLPAPTMVLLAQWGARSEALTIELMRYDASCHPDPERFQAWADDGDCPYTGVHVERAAWFVERRDLWSPGPSMRPYDLMVRVLAEACPEWSEAKRTAFEARFAKEGK